MKPEITNEPCTCRGTNAVEIVPGHQSACFAGRKWGVIVFDSRSPDEISKKRFEQNERLVKFIGTILE